MKSKEKTNYSEKKEIADGFKYVYDAHGNVMKDSLGNDIKTPKTKIINCDIIETQQHKAVTISGTLDFIDLNNSQVIKTDPISSQFFFDHPHLRSDQRSGLFFFFPPLGRILPP